MAHKFLHAARRREPQGHEAYHGVTPWNTYIITRCTTRRTIECPTNYSTGGLLPWIPPGSPYDVSPGELHGPPTETLREIHGPPTETLRNSRFF